MRYLLIWAILLSTNSFAGSYKKVELGIATWEVGVKELTGSLIISRFKIGDQINGLNASEHNKLSNLVKNTLLKSNKGLVYLKFSYSDERSQEQVGSYIQHNNEKAFSSLSYDLKKSSIKLENVNCNEKGFFKKKLICSASYESIIELELK